MGSGIAQKTAREGLSVVMVDLEQEFIDKGMEDIKLDIQNDMKQNRFSPDHVDQILDRIHPTIHLEDTKDCDLIIEAIFEDMGIKGELFSKLDRICDEKTILATNTSSFSVSDLAKNTNRSDRFIGLHFFYPSAKNQLLEIIAGHFTSPKTVAACKQYSQMTGKTAIFIKDSPGFAVNRFFVPWLNEATRIIQDGWANIPLNS
jgi:enoyl-CoA hydratase/3-hydroxyacyl-CoA dehydrogenase